MTTRRTPRTPTAPQRANTTVPRAAVTKSPSVARSHACGTPTRNSCARIPSTILDRLAAMGISREVAEAVLAAIRADAAASGAGKARTARVIAALNAQGIEATPPAIRILAGSIDIELERAAEPGKGSGGRPLGSTDRMPRRLHDPRPGWSRYREKILSLRAEHPDWSARAIARELGVSAELVSRYLRSVDK